MVLEVRKVITILEECCPWYIFRRYGTDVAEASATSVP